MLDPSLLICDEPVSALDVSVQAQILNLLDDLKTQYDLTLIFIAHDLAVVKNISDRVVVMYLGKMCEIAGSDEMYENPAHPYTALLLGSVPEPDPTAPSIRRSSRRVIYPHPSIRHRVPFPHPLPRARTASALLRNLRWRELRMTTTLLAIIL